MARVKRGAAGDKVPASLAKADLPGRSRRSGSAGRSVAAAATAAAAAAVAAATATTATKRSWDAAVADGQARDTGCGTRSATGDEAFALGIRRAKQLLLSGAGEFGKPVSAAVATVSRLPQQRLSKRTIIRKLLPGEEPTIARVAATPQPSSHYATEISVLTATAACTVAAPLAVVAGPAAARLSTDAEPPVKAQCTEPPSHKTQQAVYHRCPHCSKTFMSPYGLVVHLDVHPKHAVRCAECEIVFPSHRGLLTHRRMKHSDHVTSGSRSSSSRDTAAVSVGCSPSLVAKSVAKGFSDLTFADFSCRSFPLIAQHWCERNPRPSASTFHNFTCVECEAAFPIASALQLHKTKVHNRKEGHVCATCGREFSTGDALQFHQLTAGADQSRFLQHLQLYPSCIRSKEICVDDTHLNTEYHSLLVKVAGCDQGSSSAIAADASDSAAARGSAASAACSVVATVTLGKSSRNGSGSAADVKNGQLRKSRRS